MRNCGINVAFEIEKARGERKDEAWMTEMTLNEFFSKYLKRESTADHNQKQTM